MAELATARRLEATAAVVTGGASGIGEATCRRFLEEGASVAVLDIDEARTGAVAEALGATAVVADVADPVAMTAAVAVAVSTATAPTAPRGTQVILLAVHPASQVSSQLELRGARVACLQHAARRHLQRRRVRRLLVLVLLMVRVVWVVVVVLRRR